MIYPISFCFPTQRIREIQTKTKELSDIVPGEPYSFEDQDAYMDEYAQSQYAITKKKAGFDCMRHLEILAAGSVPLFENPEEIPTFTMTHYDRDLLAKGKEATAEEWRTHFLSNLTAPSMIRYMMDSMNLEKRERALFMDVSLPQRPDYLSLGLFYGMKEVFGENLDVLMEIPYAYTDYGKDVKELYGKGFNYTLLLEPSQRCSKSSLEITMNIREGKYDLIVFPAILRGGEGNLHNLRELLRAGVPKEKVALCIGEDAQFIQMSSWPVVQQMMSQFALFVREIE